MMVTADQATWIFTHYLVYPVWIYALEQIEVLAQNGVLLAQSVSTDWRSTLHILLKGVGTTVIICDYVRVPTFITK